jgi:hypothetical protein
VQMNVRMIEQQLWNHCADDCAMIVQWLCRWLCNDCAMIVQMSVKMIVQWLCNDCVIILRMIVQWLCGRMWNACAMVVRMIVQWLCNDCVDNCENDCEDDCVMILQWLCNDWASYVLPQVPQGGQSQTARIALKDAYMERLKFNDTVSKNILSLIQGFPKKMVTRFPCIFSLITFYIWGPVQLFICHLKDRFCVVILNIKEFCRVIWVMRYLRCELGLQHVVLYTENHCFGTEILVNFIVKIEESHKNIWAINKLHLWFESFLTNQENDDLILWYLFTMTGQQLTLKQWNCLVS